MLTLRSGSATFGPLPSLATGSLSHDRELSETRSNELGSWILTLSFRDYMFRTAKERLGGDDSVTLESGQARLMHDMHLLSTNRLIQAWHSFGSTVLMMSSLGLHRRGLDLYPPNRSIYIQRRRARCVSSSLPTFLTGKSAV